MAGDSLDTSKALECKEKGNKCFQSGDYTGAEVLYTKAINHDPSNPLLYTNRTLTLLRLQSYDRVVLDANLSIKLLPENMKAYYHLAQAQIALHLPAEALQAALRAHKYCVDEIYKGGKGGSSIGAITELVLRCKKEEWEGREDRRVKALGGLMEDVLGALEGEKQSWGAEERGEKEGKWTEKVEAVRDAFERAGEVKKRRKVPDWCIDDITFAVMLDPVVTKTGQSYDRSSIMEHLRRSPTDPLTRGPLRMEDLRPNLALKAACEEFLNENGWAVDW